MSYRNEVMLDNPLLFLPMDDGDSNPTTVLGSSPITITTDTVTKTGSHWSFGQNKKMVLNGFNTLGNGFKMTTAFWVRLPTHPSSQYVFSFQSGFGYINNAYNTRLWTSTSSDKKLTTDEATVAGSLDILADGEWHYIAHSRGVGTYIDGVKYTTSGGNSFNTNTRGIVIIGGAYTGVHATDFVGDMAGFEVFEGNLPEDRIKAHYKARLAELSDPSKYFTILSDGVEEPLQLEGAYYGGITPVVFDRVVKPSLSRYYDAQTYYPQVDSATTFTEMVTATDPFEAAYGVKLSGYPNGVTMGTCTSEPVLINGVETKPSFKTNIDGLSKYPPEFIVSAGSVSEINMAYDLKKSGTSIGGVAMLDTGIALINIYDSGTTMFSNTVFRSVEFLFHHELFHLLHESWRSEFTAMERQWTALNPEPYIGDSYTTLPVGVRPIGHIRSYGRETYAEDLADVLGAMMTTPMQTDLAQWVADDPALAAKVQMMKEWLATKHEVFRQKDYYEAIHNL